MKNGHKNSKEYLMREKNEGVRERSYRYDDNDLSHLMGARIFLLPLFFKETLYEKVFDFQIPNFQV
jgi:hypothetical protein